MATHARAEVVSPRRERPVAFGLVGDRNRRERIVEALRAIFGRRARTRVRFVETWNDAVLYLSRRGPPPMLIILDARRIASLNDALRLLNGSLATIPIVGLIPPSGQGARAAVEFIRAGVEDLVVAGDVLEVGDVSSAIGGAVGRKTIDGAMDMVGRRIPKGVQQPIRQLWLSCRAPMTIPEGATVFFRHPTTVQRRL